MAHKAESCYLALYIRCLQPLNGRWTVGNRGHRGKGSELGGEGEGFRPEDAQTMWDVSLESY